MSDIRYPRTRVNVYAQKAMIGTAIINAAARAAYFIQFTRFQIARNRELRPGQSSTGAPLNSSSTGSSRYSASRG
jgi:hypothetical protein